MKNYKIINNIITLHRTYLHGKNNINRYLHQKRKLKSAVKRTIILRKRVRDQKKKLNKSLYHLKAMTVLLDECRSKLNYK